VTRSKCLKTQVHSMDNATFPDPRTSDGGCLTEPKSWRCNFEGVLQSLRSDAGVLASLAERITHFAWSIIQDLLSDRARKNKYQHSIMSAHGQNAPLDKMLDCTASRHRESFCVTYASDSASDLPEKFEPAIARHQSGTSVVATLFARRPRDCG